MPRRDRADLISTIAGATLTSGCRRRIGPWRTSGRRWIPGRPRPDSRLDRHRADRGRLLTSGARPPEAIRDGPELHSGLTRCSATTWRSRPRRGGWVRIVDYRRAPDRMDCAVGRRHLPGRRVILTVGTDCAIGKMSVALDLRRAALEAGDRGRLRSQRPDRHDDRRLGGRGRPRHQRLPQRHRRVAGGAGRSDRGLDLRRGPGLARPPRVQLRDAGPDPRRHAARDGAGPQGRPGGARLRPPAGPILPDRAASPVHRPARADRSDRRAVEGRRGRRQYVAHRRRGGRPARDRRGRRRDGPPDRRPGSLRGRPALVGYPGGRGRAPWVDGASA